MAIRYRLKDSDTLEAIAYKYYGVESPYRIEDIINYNSLVSPYISSEREDRYIPYANGYVYVKRQNATSEVVIKKHWKLKTRPSIISSATKTYYVTDEVVIPAGVYESYIPIRSMVSGLQGNTIANTVQILGEDFIREAIDFEVVTNPEPIDGGLDGVVLTTGDYIFIPSVEEEANATPNFDNYQRAHYYYGEDLKLDQNDDMVFASGDVATVSYVDNVKQAVTQRLKAERGDNPYDQEWGTDIPVLIGNGGIPKEVLPKRIGIEIYRTLSFEDRVYEPEVIQVDIDYAKGCAYVDLQMRVVNLEQVLEIKRARDRG